MTERRNINALEVGSMDVRLRIAPDGMCQWCGRQLRNKRRRFCSKAEELARNEHSGMEASMCEWAYYLLWYKVPRFKRAVLVRDNFTCKACGANPTYTNEHGVVVPDVSRLHADHIVPLARGGRNTMDNMQCLCARCNLSKGAKAEWAPTGVLL